MKTIVLAGGCFWGVEEYFSRIDGIKNTEVGYSNGHKENPTYEEVCAHKTGHAEVCKIGYDENVITLDTILERLFRIIDPTLINRQGADIGDQYRSGVYYIDEEDKMIIKSFMLNEQSKTEMKIQTEVEKLNNYYAAEEYHQNYLKKNPGGYCHVNMDA